MKNKNWKDKAPFKYIFNIWNLSKLAIDSFASLLVYIFIVGIFLLIPVMCWYIFSSGFSFGSLISCIVGSIVLWIVGGFCVEEFEGLKGFIYIMFILIIGLIIYVWYNQLMLKINE